MGSEGRKAIQPYALEPVLDKMEKNLSAIFVDEFEKSLLFGFECCYRNVNIKALVFWR